MHESLLFQLNCHLYYLRTGSPVSFVPPCPDLIRHVHRAATEIEYRKDLSEAVKVRQIRRRNTSFNKFDVETDE